MATGLLGRTNRVFPPIWLRLGLPRSPEQLDALLEEADAADVPIDITIQPGLWGAKLSREERVFSYVGSSHFENAIDQTHAADLVQADLIQTLSAIGRPRLDIYFVRVRRAVEEFQISGVLEALESARQEGHVGYLGLCCDGNPFGALSVWQFHDAFDLLLLPRGERLGEAHETLSPLALERRTGIVSSVDLSWLGAQPFQSAPRQASEFLRRASTDSPVLVTVRSAEEVRAALDAGSESENDAENAVLTQIGIHTGTSNGAGGLP